MKTFRLSLAGLIVALFLPAFVLPAHAGQKASKEAKTASINMTVVRESNGKPVKNAEVVVHLVEGGKQKQEGLELKTHDDGKAEASGLPYGKVRIQVIAHGYRTYGEDFDLTQPNTEITIKLQKPAEQLSIYK
jgi:Carboxypeptidase regulatory-like domain